MRPKFFTLFTLIIVLGCNKPTVEKVAPSQPQISKQAPTAIASVELLDVKLAQFRNAANGKIGQEVITTWKNTGNVPVRVVDAEIISLNRDGSKRDSFNYTIFAEFDDSPGVLPGQTYTAKLGEGFKLPGFEGLPGYMPASSANVRITKVAEKSGM